MGFYIEEKGARCILDMHAHLACLSEEYGRGMSLQERYILGRRELAARRQSGVQTFYSCGTPQEWEFMRRLMEAVPCKNKDASRLESVKGNAVRCGEMNQEGCRDMLSFGIHPWHSDRFDPTDWLEYFQSCRVIGEIGMDSVWCGISPAVQRKVFERQLALAAELGKPVILHTKGQEREIAAMLRGFPQKVCVHWYSGDIEIFERFLELGCYFTLGPDFAGTYGKTAGQGRTASKEPGDGETASFKLYCRMAQAIPLDRLFLETDGISAVAWALGLQNPEFGEIPSVLKDNLRCISGAKGVTQEAMQRQIWQNLQEFQK